MSLRTRIKRMIKKCRAKGKWDLLARLVYKYELTPMGKEYND